MLDKLRFSDDMTSLCAAFDKSPKSATMDEYYKAFQSLREDQWQRLCTWAKDNMETFPKISHLKNKAGEWGFWGKRGGVSFTSLDCACGYSMSIATYRIERELYYDCSGAGVGCNRSYQGGWLLNPNPPIHGVTVTTAVNVDKYRQPVIAEKHTNKIKAIQDVLGELKSVVTP